MNNLVVSVFLQLSLGVLTSSQGDDQWRPPNTEKLYKPGEPTYIFTNGNGRYNQAWYVVDNRQQIIFQVEACSGAMLAFLTGYSQAAGEPSFDDQQVKVEIILGSDDNQRSVIRFGTTQNGRLVFNTSTPHILHCNELRTFWLQWDHSIGKITVGKGPLVGEQGFMQWTNTIGPLLFYNTIGLSCIQGGAAKWTVHENSAAYLILATSDEHKYTTMWKSVENKKFWTFGVRAGGDVHIVLTTRLGRTDSDLYEFVIGGWFNNMSVIRTQILGGGESIKGTYNKTNLVSATGMRYFWISWFNGLISFGQGDIYGKYRLLSWLDPRPITVRYLAITTGFGNTGRWSILDDQESMSYLFTSPTSSANPNDKYSSTWVYSPQQNYFMFVVTACEEASILFSSSPEVDESFAIELIIGFDRNTKTILRYLFTGQYLNFTDTLNVLSCTQSKFFWISWHDGFLRFGGGFTYSENSLLETRIYNSGTIPPPIQALAFATVTSEGIWRIRDSVGDGLRVVTPSEFNNFDQFWRSVSLTQFVTFRVRACSDCHVALSPTLGVDCGESYLDLVISGWSNTQSQLRLVQSCAGDRGGVSIPVNTTGLLQCDHYIDLWVSWNSGRLQFGRGALPGYHVILDHTMNQTYPIQAVSFSSGFTYAANFSIDSSTGDYFMLYTGINAESLRWLSLRSSAFWVSMKIRACTDILIYLCPSVQLEQDYFKLVLGTANNTKSMLYVRDNLLMTANTTNLFSCMDDRHMWISWSSDGSHVEVGTGRFPDRNAILQGNERNPFGVRALAFQTQSATNDDSNYYYSRFTIQRNAFQQLLFQTPKDFTYEQVWESVEHRRGVVFGIMACSDCHVLLSTNIRNVTNMLDVVIGGWTNSRSVIRLRGQPEYVVVETLNILHCSETRFFWITWQEGTVEVGRGKLFGIDRIMAYQPLELYTVAAIGYSTGYDFDGTWTVIADDGLLPTAPPITEDPGQPAATSSSGDVKTDLRPEEVAGIIIGVIAIIIVTVNVVVYLRSRSLALDFGTPSTRSRK